MYTSSNRMDSWLSNPVLYLLLLYSQMITASFPDIRRDNIPMSPGDMELHDSLETESPDFVRLLLMAAQQNYRAPQLQWKGIPFRPVRRIGSEFLGKRSEPFEYEDDFLDENKRAKMGSEFLGKRRMGSEFLGKRRMGSEFLGKRKMGSEFLGKRRMGSEFLGKRKIGSEFLGKREFEFLPEMGHLELSPVPVLLESPLRIPVEAGEPFAPAPHATGIYNAMSKRGLGSEFLGKRKPNANDFTWKRTRLGSEFLGKRSAQPEQPMPYLQTARDFHSMKSLSTSHEEGKNDDNPQAEN